VLLVVYVVSRIDLREFVDALEPSALALLFGFALVWNVALLTADAFATSRVYRQTVGQVGFRDLWLIRGASYLPSLLNHHIGQGWVTYFLSKIYGASLWRVAGATLVVYLTTLACLLTFAATGMMLRYEELKWMGPVLLPLFVCGLLFLVVVRLKPAFLRRRRFLEPMFEVGVVGHLRHTLYRAPHMFVLFLGSWVPLHLFEVPVPFLDALGLVPPVLLVAALPITPQGVGVRDTLSVHLFAAYAAGTPEQAAARVAASTLGWAAAILLVQAAFSPLLMKRAYLRMGGTQPPPQARPMPE
jgi:hypothetical protein